MLPLDRSKLLVRLFLAAALLFTPVFGEENKDVPPDDPECDDEAEQSSISWYFGVGDVTYSRADMLMLARNAVVEGQKGGQMPRTFDQAFGVSYTNNLARGQNKLQLGVEAAEMSGQLIHPRALKVPRYMNAQIVERWEEEGEPKQIVTNNTLVDILHEVPGRLTLKVYKKDAMGPMGGPVWDKKYVILPNSVPLREIILRTPDGGVYTNTLEFILIDRENAGGVKVDITRFTRNMMGKPSDSQTKQVFTGSLDGSGNVVFGTLLEEETITYSNRGAKLYDYTLVRELKRIKTTPSGIQPDTLEVVSRRLEEYKDFSLPEDYGNSKYKRLMREVEGYGTPEARETRYTWIEDLSNTMLHGRLKTKVTPDGNWELYEYTDSETTAVYQQIKYSAWRDAGFGSAQDGSQADLANARKETISIAENTGFTKTISHGGVVTSQEEFSSIPETNGDLINTLTLKSGDGQPLSVRTWKVYAPNASAHLANRIAWMENPDGTAETFSYTATTNGGFTMVHCKGAGDRNGVTEGIETTTEYNEFVEASSEVVKDIASGLTLRFWHAPTVDMLGRPTRIEYNGNSNDYETFQYACCGLEHKRNRDGSVTTWTRDPLKRIYLQYDYRFAADSSPLITATTYDGLTTTVTKGGVLESETTTLLNGKITQVKTPDQNNDGNPETTTIAYASGGRIVTTTNPDGGTEIRETYRDGQLKSITGTAVPDRSYLYGTHTQGGNGLWTQEIRLTSTGGTGEWERSYNDGLNRIIRTERPYGSGTAADVVTYHGTGAAAGGRTQRTSFTDADGKVTTYGYDTDGHVTTTTEQMPGSQSRVTTTSHQVVDDSALGVCEQHTTQVNGVVTEVSSRSGDGYSSRTTSLGRVTTTVKTVSDASGNATITTTNPDDTQQVQTITGNLVIHEANLDTASNVVTSTGYTYDALRRVVSATDARTGTTTVNSYTPAGQPLSVTDPGSRTTTFAYDVMGRRILVDAPDTVDAENNALANITYTSWHPTGLEKATWGDQTYPVYTGYDEQGRVNELRTYRNLAHGTEPTAATGGYDLTTWLYNAQGLLSAKRYADNEGPTYTYTAGRKLATRTWARGVVTTYTYNKGLLTSIVYSDSTPNVTVSYNAFGRQTSVVQTNQSRIDYAYDPVTLALDTETISYDLDHDGTPDFTRVLDRSQDSILRDSGWQLKDGSTVENTVIYGYDAAGRINSVVNGTDTFTYGYLANSNLSSTVVGPVHTVTNVWNSTRDALLSKENKVSTTVVSKYEYTVNALGQRSSVNQSGSAFASATSWDWGYDGKGQVTRAEHATTPANHRVYQYDSIGNRKKSAESLMLPGSDNYLANVLNQYSAINHQLSTINPTYDADGNMTFGPVPAGNATLTWDGENRLVSTTIGENTVNYFYDFQGRRIAKINGGTTELTVYDEWNPIADFNGTSLAKIYTWGIDLSNSLQGVGGVGGLLGIKQSGSAYFSTYDDNGNVSEYLTALGDVAAHFEYDVFGQIVDTSGSLEDFPVHFSTKRKDSETGLIYYGYRYYNLEIGRWVSKDPLDEEGGLNVYSFSLNDGVNFVDFLGLKGGKKFKTQDEAAKAALQEAYQMTKQSQQEMCGWIIKKGKCYEYTPPGNNFEQSERAKESIEKAKSLGWSDKKINDRINDIKKGACVPTPEEKPEEAVANYHTHGTPIKGDNSAEHFSSTDIDMYRSLDVTGYLATAEGRFARHFPRLKSTQYKNPNTGIWRRVPMSSDGRPAVNIYFR
ncbi:MAG: RHS repeat-associated core domain-containing protein [Luteolibacter sp.]